MFHGWPIDFSTVLASSQWRKDSRYLSVVPGTSIIPLHTSSKGHLCCKLWLIAFLVEMSIYIPSDVWSEVFYFVDDLQLLRLKVVSKSIGTTAHNEFHGRSERYKKVVVPAKFTDEQLSKYLTLINAKMHTKTLILKNCENIGKAASLGCMHYSPCLQEVDLRGVPCAAKAAMIQLLLRCSKLWKIKVDRRLINITPSSLFDRTPIVVIKMHIDRKFKRGILRSGEIFRCCRCEQSLDGQNAPCFKCQELICKGCQNLECTECSNIVCFKCCSEVEDSSRFICSECRPPMEKKRKRCPDVNNEM